MAEYGRKIGRAAAPLLIYLGISYGVLIMMGISGAYPQTSGLAGIDAALATTLTASVFRCYGGCGEETNSSIFMIRENKEGNVGSFLQHFSAVCLRPAQAAF